MAHLFYINVWFTSAFKAYLYIIILDQIDEAMVVSKPYNRVCKQSYGCYEVENVMFDDLLSQVLDTSVIHAPGCL